MRDGFHPQGMSCGKKQNDEKREKTENCYLENLDKSKNYKKQNREKMNLYEKNRKELYLKFKLACNLRSRTSSAFKSQNVMKKVKHLLY